MFYQFNAKDYFCVEFTEKMTNKYDELINAFENKLRKLIEKYKELQLQNATLKAELERKQDDLMHAHQEVLELRKSSNHLKIALSMNGSEQERIESKQRINKMVGEIDKCLTLLND